MPRIKIIKDFKQYKTGDVVNVSRNTAHALIDGGYGVKTKDMVPSDYSTKKPLKSPYTKSQFRRKI